MKKMNCIIMLLLTLFIIACKNNNQQGNNGITANLDSATNSTDTLVSNLTSLPKDNYTLIQHTPIISEYLAHIESKTNIGQYYAVVVDEDNNLLVQIGHDGTLVDETYDLNIGVENPFGAEAKLELVDINKDGLNDELAIWFYVSDGNNGIESGFELEQNWLIIYDLVQRESMLHLLYNNHNANYYAGENANTSADDYHAKMADDTDWNICSYSYQIELKNGDIHLSNFDFQKEGMGECYVDEFEAGIYSYNLAKGEFQLNRQ